jgi:4-amino-4-deoxy-L-arabinose transferase-like glycosyltransferase
MDSVLAVLEVGALWLTWRALASGRLRWSIGAAVVMGLAFNVKLTEMLIALPALVLLWVWAAEPGMRIRTVLATGATFLIVALSWTAIASITPLSRRPFPIGSSNGSIWHVTLVYDGIARLSGHTATGNAEGGAGPLRLLTAGPMHYSSLIGVALLATALFDLLALAVLIAWDRERLKSALAEPGGRFAIGIVLWFLAGLVTLSVIARLEPRYLEAFAPAGCAVLGMSLSVLWRYGKNRRSAGGSNHMVLMGQVALVCAVATLLVVALSKDVYLIRGHHSDSVLTDFSTPAVSRYLRAHRDRARYEVASANINDIVGLVARDDLPVLVLNSVDGSLTRTATLRAQVAAGRVRFYFVGSHPCHTGRYCPGNQIWAYTHSISVPGLHGLRRFATY